MAVKFSFYTLWLYSVEKLTEKLSREINSGNFFSLNADFTKYLLKKCKSKFLQFSHCVKVVFSWFNWPIMVYLFYSLQNCKKKETGYSWKWDRKSSQKSLWFPSKRNWFIHSKEKSTEKQERFEFCLKNDQIFVDVKS